MTVHPRRNAADFGKIMRSRAMIPFDPTAHLPFQVALWLAEIGQDDGFIIETMKNEFLAAQRNGVRQIRMATGILLDGERSAFAWKVSAEKRLQFEQVQLFAGAHRGWAIPKIGHLLFSAAEKIVHFRLLCTAQR